MFLNKKENDKMSMENNKLENNITIDKVICGANEFILDFDIVVQVCAGPGSVGLIVLGSLCGELSGAASITDFTTGGTGCSDGTVFGFITPDGKNVVLLFTDFDVGAIGCIPNQSLMKSAVPLVLNCVRTNPIRSKS